MPKTKNPLDLENNRYGLFMNEKSFELDIFYGREYLRNDAIYLVTIHRINITETKSHALYGQSKPSDRSYLNPITINVMLDVEEGAQKYYGDTEGGLTRDDTGNLVFGVYLEELKEKDIEINRGDIVEFNISGIKNRYYEVESANTISDTMDKTLGGFKPYWKKITAVPVKSDVFLHNDGSKGV